MIIAVNIYLAVEQNNYRDPFKFYQIELMGFQKYYYSKNFRDNNNFVPWADENYCVLK